jgi:peptide/nickel transport system substrate-binding protein
MGAAGAVTLAGCSNSGGDNGGGGKSVKHISNTNKVPANLQWNQSNSEGAPSISQYALFDAFVKYNYKTGKFEPYAISDWTYSGKTFELNVRDGLTWANGDKVTSGDVATQLRIGMYTGLPYASYTNSIKTPDEKTAVMNFDSKINKKIIEFDVLAETLLRQKESVFGKYADTLKQNKKKGQRQITKFKWTEPIASGPFAFESAGQQQLVLKRRDDHPDSKKINFDEYVFRYLDSNQAVHQALTNKELDSVFSVFTKPRIVNQLPDAIKQVQTPSNFGYGLVPNHNHKHAGDRAVRQAVQHVINREQVAKNVSKSSKMVPKFPVAIEVKNQERWLGKAMDDFDTYGAASSQTKKATKILEKAGYSKKGGTWKDSDGKTVKLPILVPSDFSDWVTATKTLVDQLSSFGFESVMNGREYSTLTDTAWPDGNFTLAAGSWLPGGAAGAFPYFSLYQQLVSLDWGNHKYNYPTAINEFGGSKKDVTVPSRTGSGKLTTNPHKRLNEYASSTKKSKIKDIVIEQAWVTNQDLPMLPVLEKFEQTFVTGGKKWDIPKPDAEVAQVHWANTWLPRKGKMKYTGN